MSAFWIVRITVSDDAQYAEYTSRVGFALEQFGGRFLARGGTCVTKEGREHARNVIVEFPSYEAAVACYDSPVYQEAFAYQVGAAERDFCIVEGI